MLQQFSKISTILNKYIFLNKTRLHFLCSTASLQSKKVTSRLIFLSLNYKYHLWNYKNETNTYLFSNNLRKLDMETVLVAVKLHKIIKMSYNF